MIIKMYWIQWNLDIVKSDMYSFSDEVVMIEQ